MSYEKLSMEQSGSRIEKLGQPANLYTCPTCGPWWGYDPNRAEGYRTATKCPSCGK